MTILQLLLQKTQPWAKYAFRSFDSVYLMILVLVRAGGDRYDDPEAGRGRRRRSLCPGAASVTARYHIFNRRLCCDKKRSIV